MADRAARFVRGETSKAVLLFGRAIACDRAVGSTVELPSGRSTPDLGQFDTARRCIGEAIAMAEASGERWWEADPHRMAERIELMAPERDAAKAELFRTRASQRGARLSCARRRVSPVSCAIGPPRRGARLLAPSMAGSQRASARRI